MAQDVAQPCPVCVGDDTPTDGRKNGRCHGGADDGAACDAEGDAGVFGCTSTDCPPSGAAVGTLPIDIPSLTTNASTLAPKNADCASQMLGGQCPCADQRKSTPVEPVNAGPTSAPAAPSTASAAARGFAAASRAAAARTARCASAAPAPATERPPAVLRAVDCGAGACCDARRATWRRSVRPPPPPPRSTPPPACRGRRRLTLPLESVDATADAASASSADPPSAARDATVEGELRRRSRRRRRPRRGRARRAATSRARRQQTLN